MLRASIIRLGRRAASDYQICNQLEEREERREAHIPRIICNESEEREEREEKHTVLEFCKRIK